MPCPPLVDLSTAALQICLLIFSNCQISLSQNKKLLKLDLGRKGFGQMNFGEISRFGVLGLEGIWGLGFSDLWGILVCSIS